MLRFSASAHAGRRYGRWQRGRLQLAEEQRQAVLHLNGQERKAPRSSLAGLPFIYLTSLNNCKNAFPDCLNF